ncbi:hypothetical protein GCM10027074_61780 [Streptomyces deserti]
MPAARITEEQVTEETGGGAVREDALGTHGLSPRKGGAGLGRGDSNGRRAWRYVLTQGVHALVRRDRR